MMFHDETMNEMLLPIECGSKITMMSEHESPFLIE